MHRLLVALLIPLLSGCGYTLTHRLKEPFASSKGIFIPVFDNRTDEMGAEVVFTDALIRELQSRGETILNKRDPGGLEMVGAVVTLDAVPTAFTEPKAPGLGLREDRRIPSQIGITATINLTLKETGSGKVVWSKNFSSFRRVEAPLDRTFNYQGPSQIGPLTQSIVESRYNELAKLIMYDVYDQMTILSE